MNLLALSLLPVLRDPLQEVLRKEMDPIGASRTWRWHGYTEPALSVDDRSSPSAD